MKDLRGHGDTVYALAFNRDNTTLASGKVIFQTYSFITDITIVLQTK